MENLPENRTKILEEFCFIVERGELLGHRITFDEIVNIHQVDEKYAIVHFSKTKRMVYKIEWIGSLADVEKKGFHWNPAKYTDGSHRNYI